MSKDQKKAVLPAELSIIAVSTDATVFMLQKQKGATYRKDADRILKILLIRRGIDPYKDCWALPGGFLRQGERIRQCALREITEETGITPATLIPVGVFDEVDRDPRGRVISHAFAAVLSEEPGALSGGTDAEDAQWFQISLKKMEEDEQKNIWKLILENQDIKMDCTLRRKESHYGICSFELAEQDEALAFDHAVIIAESLTTLQKIAKQPDAVLDLLPEYFTLSSLQQVQETITGVPVGVANFRRKMADYVVETEEYVTGAGHRPARLYTRRPR